MQSHAAPRAGSDAALGAIIVGAVALVLAVILLLAGGTAPSTTLPQAGGVGYPSIEFRDGERQMLSAEQKALEQKALIDFRQAERDSR